MIRGLWILRNIIYAYIEKSSFHNTILSQLEAAK